MVGVCSNNLYLLKQQFSLSGIQTYVILIGEEGRNVFPSFWQCVVEDPKTGHDIIVFDPTSMDYSPISDLLCKNPPNGYDIKITEVKPTSDDGYNAFIEVLNHGATASIMACMGGIGDTNCAISRTVPTGEYLVSSVGGSISAKYPSTLPTASPLVEYLLAILRRMYIF